MKKVWKSTLMITVVIFVAGSIFGYFLYNKPHRDVQKAKVDFTIEASVLLSEFEPGSAVATKKYDGKILLVSGKVESVNFNDSIASVQLSGDGSFFGINCSFNGEGVKGLAKIQIGDVIEVKGECKGYIDDVILNNCFLIN